MHGFQIKLCSQIVKKLKVIISLLIFRIKALVAKTEVMAHLHLLDIFLTSPSPGF